MISVRCALCLAVLSFLCCSAAPAADWPQFRGINSSGVAANDSVPDAFGPGINELWSVSVASGHSAPCVAGDSVYLTTFDAPRKQLAVVCLERVTGETRWSHNVLADEIEKGHPSFNPASSTPASDGERVVAYFGSFGLICFDVAGEKLWEIPMPLAKSFGGNATSPIIVGERVILYRGNYVDHYLLAVDKYSGEELWKVPQQEKFTGEMACTAVPIVSGDRVIVHSARAVQAFDVATGKRKWIARCATTATSTPVLVGNEVIVAAWNKMGEPSLRPPLPDFEKLLAEHDQDGNGSVNKEEFPQLWIFHRPDGAEAPMNGATVRFQSADHDKDGAIRKDEWTNHLRGVEKFRSGYTAHGILSIPLDSEGVLGATQIRTLATQGIPEVPSPLCDGDYVYSVKNGGVLTCLNRETGERVYRIRTGGGGTHYASPLIAGSRLLTFSGDGRISVVRLGPKPKLLKVNQMNEGVYATPAIADDTLYVRTHSRLYAFKGKDATN